VVRVSFTHGLSKHACPPRAEWQLLVFGQEADGVGSRER
jgi:hypothetical protein